VYEACGPAESGQTCIDRLADIRAGGFTLVLNYRQWWASADDLRHYAETADRLGMRIIWPLDGEPWRMGGDLRARYPQLAVTCGCSDDEGFKRYAIGLVKDLPATWGYYVGDEVPLEQRAQAAAFADHVKTLDPSHPRLFVALEVPATAGANLEPFAQTADVLAGDYYPIGGNDPVDSTATVARNVGRVADAHSKPSGMVLQAFSWEMYPGKEGVVPRWPTADEIRRMRDLAIEHSRPSLILWYSYFDIAASSDPGRHWADLLAGAFAPLPPAPKRVVRPTLRVPSRVHGAATRRRATRQSLNACGARPGCRSAVRRRFVRRPLLRWRLEGSERAELNVYRLAGGKRAPVTRMQLSGHSGTVVLASLVKRGASGRYLVTLRAHDPSGGLSAAAQARFRAVR
jgi:hypothetical protein